MTSMRTDFRYLRLLAAFLVALPTFCAAQGAGATAVWSYDDEEGVSHFSNVPDNRKYRLVLGKAEFWPRPGSGGGVRLPKISPHSLANGLLPYSELVTGVAGQYKLDPALLHAVIHVESRHNPAAISPKGAVGLMQLMPATARRMGIETFRTPEGNITAGARYLRFLLDTFGSDVSLALAAYNAGENAVIRHGNRIPPYRETEAYVPAVLQTYKHLSGG